MIDVNKIKDGLYDFMAAITSSNLVLTFNNDLVEDNLINGAINGSPIDEVTFDTDHDTTMELIANEIATLPDVLSTEVTGDREITIACKEIANMANGWVVTEGDSQASISVLRSSSFNIQWERDNQNKAANPRIGLDILSLPAVGSPITLSISDNGVADIAHESNLILRVIATGDNACSFCTLLKMASFFPTEIEALRDSTGLSILSSTEPNNVSGFNDQFVEERWTMDITFTFAYSTGKKADVGLIEEVEIEGTLVDLDNSERTVNIDVIKPE